MKTLNRYIQKTVLLIFLSAETLTSFSQSPPPADFIFQTPALVSGTANSVGALYRFSNVKTGVDALVTITAAVNATLATLDATGQGWNAAFQPNITVQSMTTGYIEFRIDFVTAGTSTPISLAQVAATALDVDGYNFNANQRLFEFEQFDMGQDSYVEYDFTGTDLALTFAGTAIRGTNVGGVDYGSINLSPNVRFTIFRSNVSTITVRSGANNQDVFNNVTRQRSFYFARFNYPNSAILDVSDLKSFSAAAIKKNVVQLNWELDKDHSIQKAEIEYSEQGESFTKINTLSNPQAGISGYTHNGAKEGVNYYRIKFYEANGTSFYSKIVKANTASATANVLQVFPTVCTNKATINIQGKFSSSAATLQLTDYNGRIYYSKMINISEGMNAVTVPLSRHIPPGNYIVSLAAGNERLTGRVIKSSW